MIYCNNMNNACVIIPAYNEAKTIHALVGEIAGYCRNIVVVDDGSSDQTCRAADEAGAIVLRNINREGKGAAVQKGLAYISGLDWDPVIFMDGDGQHAPSDIPGLAARMEEGGYDIVVGNRMENPSGMPHVRIVVNWAMSLMISRLLGVRIHDSQCGFKIARRHVVECFSASTSSFEFDTEILVSAARNGFKIGETAVSCIYNKKRKSYISPIKDTLRFFSIYFKLSKEKYTAARPTVGA